MGERSILSSFLSEEDANRAAEQVQGLGIDVVQVAPLHALAVSGGDEPKRKAFPITGRIPSLASLTLHTTPDSRDAGVLLGANPIASGMSDGEDVVTGRNYLLTVVCDDSLVDTAVNIIKACNGYT